MKQWLSVILAACALAVQTYADELEKNFYTPPASARPWVYLFALDGNMTSNGITADLEAMQRVGIGGLVYFEVDQGAPKGPARFGGPMWREMFKHLCSEANRLGMHVNMNNDAGWCGSGGPWITPELSMQKVVWSETAVQGPSRFDAVLPQPKARMDFYRDIAVFAFPAPEDDGVKMAEAAPKITASVMNKTFNADNLLDGDEETTVTVPLPTKNKPQSLTFEFPQPFTARRLALTPGWSSRKGCQGMLQVSDDGKSFRDMHEVKIAKGPISITFPKVTARYFRLLFTKADATLKQLAIAEVDLNPRYCLDDLEGKSALAKIEFLPQADYPALPAALTIPRDRIVNLTAKFDKTGRLAWDVPAGKWIVLRFGHTSTGVDNHPAPVEGRGLECDKLSKVAAEAMFNGLMGKVIADSKPLVGENKTLVSTHIDSWEVRTQNWTPKFREEFQARRGYDPLPFLPVMTGRVVDSMEVAERFLWDVRQTVSDLLVDNYAGHFCELAHRNGIRLSIEAYGGGNGHPADDMTYAGRADEPMAEFWAHKPYVTAWSCPEMASSAHVYGKRILGAESFTSDRSEKWQSHPFAVKVYGDWAFCAGVNRLVIHRYALQPWTNPDRAPGLAMGPWGLHYERTQTWWEQSKAWHEYIARCQYLLQQGLFVADICYLAAERSPQRWQPPSPSLESPKYHFDGCPPEVLLTRMTVKDGRLVLPDGMSYRVLVLPEVPTMTPTLLRKIKELIASGATVIGSRPLKSPSLAGYPQCDDEVKKLATELWGDCDGKNVKEHAFGKGRVICGKAREEVLAGMSVPPDFTFSGKASDVELRYIHRTIGDADVYFVANPETNAVEALCAFRVAAKQPELWWPDTGRTETAAAFVEKDGVTRLPLQLDPVGSVFVVFRKESGSPKSEVGTKNWLELNPVQEISGAWEVSFDPKWGGPARPVTFEKLEDWSKRAEEGVRYYSGTAIYRKTISVAPNLVGKDKRLFLDLGKVAVMAEVKLNGKDLGILWKPPFRVDITDTVKAGDNSLELKVVNLWINRMIGDEQLPEDSQRKPYGTLGEWPQWLNEGKPSPSGRFTFTSWRLWKKDDALVESGLLGTVTLQSQKQIKVKSQLITPKVIKL